MKPSNPEAALQAEAEQDIIRRWMEWLAEQGYVLAGRRHHRLLCPVHDDLHGYDNPASICCCEEILAECWGQDPGCPHPHVEWIFRPPLGERTHELPELLREYTGGDPPEQGAHTTQGL